MPTYDYTCAACGHRFERFESIHDDGSKACEKCGKKKARRMLGTGAGLIFKGSGFYTTDYKNPDSGGARGSSGDSDSGSEDSGSGDSDSGSGDSDSGSTDTGSSTKSESKPKEKEKKESKK